MLGLSLSEIRVNNAFENSILLIFLHSFSVIDMVDLHIKLVLLNHSCADKLKLSIAAEFFSGLGDCALT